jgi:hypothetical protein
LPLIVTATRLFGKVGLSQAVNNGMITYHLPIKFADLIPNSVWVPKAPEWDGHTSRDVCDRLIKEAKTRKILLYK